MHIGTRIAEARTKKGWSQAKLAKAVNKGQSTIHSWESGRTEPSRDDAARVAEALGLARIELEGWEPSSPSLQPVSRQVPVVGTVQAGAWVEQAVSVDPDFDASEYVAFDDPRYRRAKLFCLNVRGPSANLFYPDGTRVICGHPHELGIQAGDFVVAQRFEGGKVEYTLKQLEVTDAGDILLWPRSNHPDFQEPIRVRRGDELAQEGVAIIGVVIANYNVQRTGYGPMLDL